MEVNLLNKFHWNQGKLQKWWLATGETWKLTTSRGVYKRFCFGYTTNTKTLRHEQKSSLSDRACFGPGCPGVSVQVARADVVQLPAGCSRDDTVTETRHADPVSDERQQRYLRRRLTTCNRRAARKLWEAYGTGDYIGVLSGFICIILIEFQGHWGWNGLFCYFNRSRSFLGNSWMMSMKTVTILVILSSNVFCHVGEGGCW